VRVAIAEDSLLLRDGLVRLLSSAGLEVAVQCATAAELLIRVREDPPDVVIVDIRLPPTHTDEGMRAALHIRAHHPDVGVLVLSQHLELGLATQLLGDSADGAGYGLMYRSSSVE
jgi:DNA-binding NarL/FixJ family response regulator